MLIEKLLGRRRTRQLTRLIRHSKTTILCLILTIVVLRGIIGAGKFGTPEQDFLILRNNLMIKKLPKLPSPNNNSTLLLLATCPGPTPRSLKNKMDYSELHGFEIEVVGSGGIEGRRGRKGVEFVWWVEGNVVITDLKREVRWGDWRECDVVVMRWERVGGRVGVSLGSVVVRSRDEAVRVFSEWRERKAKAKAGEGEGGMVFWEEKEWEDKYGKGRKVCLEKEGMMRKYDSLEGLGKWPLVMVFEECSPCGESGGGGREGCVKEMEGVLDIVEKEKVENSSSAYTEGRVRRGRKVGNLSSSG